MKKIIKILLGTFILLVIVYFIIFNIQNYFLLNSLNKYWTNDQNEDFKLINYESVRCNWNIFKPEVAFVDKSITLGDIEELEIFFYKAKNLFKVANEDWENSYTGGTTIKNTTFPQLLAMVKEDCYQFQINGKKENISWIWMKYDKEKEEKEKYSIDEDEMALLKQIQLTDEEIENYRKLNSEEREKLIRERFKILNQNDE